MASPSPLTLWWRFCKFCAVGILNTLVDLSVYYLLTRSIWAYSDLITLPKALSYVAATICSFTLNRYWTFEKRDAPSFAEAARFYGTVGLGIFINVGIQYTWVRALGFNDLVGVLIAALGTAVWGFCFSQFYVFKK